jgi:hypothetical protein
MGVIATDDVGALIDLRPDCVVCMPHWPDVDLLVELLRAGITVVTTARLVTGDEPDVCAGDGIGLDGDVPQRAAHHHPRVTGLHGLRECVDVAGVRLCGPPDVAALHENFWRTEPDYQEALDELARGIGSDLGFKQSPEWPILYGYRVMVEGDPNVSLELSFQVGDLATFDIGTTTAMPAINVGPR